MGNTSPIRGLMLVVVLLAVPVWAVPVGADVGAAAPAGPPGATVADPADGATPDGVTPMVDVADKRDSQRSDTVTMLLVANVLMVGAGALLLWRRCGTSATTFGDPQAPPP